MPAGVTYYVERRELADGVPVWQRVTDEFPLEGMAFTELAKMMSLHDGEWRLVTAHRGARTWEYYRSGRKNAATE